MHPSGNAVKREKWLQRSPPRPMGVVLARLLPLLTNRVQAQCQQGSDRHPSVGSMEEAAKRLNENQEGSIKTNETTRYTRLDVESHFCQTRNPGMRR
uniref:Secreted protein n=1 Tax=Panagrellus redivivus TaxID=6233 RepID=A0A7E4V7J9_PANRE